MSEHPDELVDDLKGTADGIAETGEESLAGILKASNLTELQAELASFFHKNSGTLTEMTVSLEAAIRVAEERSNDNVESLRQELRQVWEEMQSSLATKKEEEPMAEVKKEAEIVEEPPKEAPKEEPKEPEPKPQKKHIY